MPRRRTSDAAKRAAGTYRKDRSERVRSAPRVIREPVPKPAPAPPVPHWSLTPAELAIWREMAPRVTARGRISDPEGHALNNFCTLAARISQAAPPSAADVAAYDQLAGQLFGLRRPV